jgi:tetratricopeptide (TPR) repeat protein
VPEPEPAPAPAPAFTIRDAILIFAAALAVRIVHVWFLRNSPFFGVLMGDSKSYDEWAQRIARGAWFGGEVFYQAPLYPYFLGVVYAVAGHDLLVVRVLQALLGSAACVLLGLAAAGLSSRRAGLFAGLALAFYAPAIFFDALIQKAVLDVFLICLALWIISRIIPSRRPGLPPSGRPGLAGQAIAIPNRLWLILGLTMGALSLTRENALVFVVVILAWVLLSGRSLVPAMVFAGGLALVLAPVALRNYAVGGGFYVTTSQFGPNFYIGNNPYTDGSASSMRGGRGSPEYERQDAIDLAERALRRPLSPAEVSSYWTDRALQFIRLEPVRWLRLMARKTALLWNRSEMLDTEAQESHSEWSPVLRLLGWIGHFGVLVPLALVGVVLTWSDWRRLWVIYAMAAAYAASVVIFFVYARYRYPLVPFLILFAAAGLSEAISEVTQAAAPAAMPSRGQVNPRRGISVSSRRGWGPAAIGKKLAESPVEIALTTAVGIAIVVVTNWPMLAKGLPQAITEHNLGATLQEAGRIDEAIEHYRQAIALKPDYAAPHNNLGTALVAKGDLGGARISYERALQLMPDYTNAHYNLGNLLLQANQPDQAVSHFRQSIASGPGSADVHNNLGIALAETDRTDEAIAEFRKALEYQPNSARAHENIGRVLAGEDRLPEAIAAFRDGLRAAPASAEIRNHLAIALATSGNFDEAIQLWEEALKLQPSYEAARKNLEFTRAARQRMIERR